MKELTQDQKRSKIAEFCGWKFFPEGIYRPGISCVPAWENGDVIASHPPDYFNDLNACHEMEKAMPLKEMTHYMAVLYHAVVPEELKYPDHFLTWDLAWRLTFATATTRAETFGKSLSLW